jgi:hypothetical protein
MEPDRHDDEAVSVPSSAPTVFVMDKEHETVTFSTTDWQIIGICKDNNLRSHMTINHHRKASWAYNTM